MVQVRFIYRVVELAVRVAKVSDTNLGTIPEVYEYVSAQLPSSYFYDTDLNFFCRSSTRTSRYPLLRLLLLTPSTPSRRLFMVIAIGIFALMFPFTIKPDRIYGPIEFLFALGRERRKSRKARKEEGLSSVTLEARY